MEIVHISVMKVVPQVIKREFPDSFNTVKQKFQFQREIVICQYHLGQHCRYFQGHSSSRPHCSKVPGQDLKMSFPEFTEKYFKQDDNKPSSSLKATEEDMDLVEIRTQLELSYFTGVTQQAFVENLHMQVQE